MESENVREDFEVYEEYVRLNSTQRFYHARTCQDLEVRMMRNRRIGYIAYLFGLCNGVADRILTFTIGARPSDALEKLKLKIERCDEENLPFSVPYEDVEIEEVKPLPLVSHQGQLEF